MRSTFYGLEIGRTALNVAQLSLDVTSHNIANVETKGYTRQRIISTAYDPFYTIGKALPVTQANVGGGVRVMVLDQIRSSYLDKRFRSENTLNGYWQKRVETMSYLESYFDNVVEETSINFSLAEFFRAMKVESEDTVESAQRTLLRDAGLALTQQLNSIYSGLMDLQDIQNQAVKITVDEINRLAAELVELNKSIYGYELSGLIANDLRDKRNLVLDDLSKLVPIEYTEQSDGTGSMILEVKIGSETLVKHDKCNELDVMEGENVIKGEKPVWIPIWKAQRTPGPPITSIFLPDPANPGSAVEIKLRSVTYDEADKVKSTVAIMNHIQSEFGKLYVQIDAKGELVASKELPKEEAEDHLREAKRLYALMNSIISTIRTSPADPWTGEGNLAFNCDLGGNHAVMTIGGVVFARSAGCVGNDNDFPDIPSLAELPQVQYTQALSEPKDFLPLDVRGGELMAYIDMRDGQGPEFYDANGEKGIPYYIDLLNNIARALVSEVNAQHRLGWTDPPNGASQTGINFFSQEPGIVYTYTWNGSAVFRNPAYDGKSAAPKWIDGSGAAVLVDETDTTNFITTAAPFSIDLITAKNICLSAEVMDSVFNIAASSVKVVRGVLAGDKTELQSGNNENMNELYKLFNKKGISFTLDSGRKIDIGSLDGYVTSLRFDVGNSLSFAKKTADNCTILTLSAENQRLSISGVSLDEEMTNMVKFQHAYNGAARVITVMDELLDKLINGTGRVGL